MTETNHQETRPTMNTITQRAETMLARYNKPNEYTQIIIDLLAENEALHSQLALAREGLEKYGAHKESCKALRFLDSQNYCDCGFAQTLGRMRERE